MIIGAAFIFLEVKTAHGVSAIIGVVIFIVGFLLVFQLPRAASPNPSLPPLGPPGIADASYALLALLAVGIVIASLYLRSIREGLKRRPKVNDPSFAIGKEGKMQTDLPRGAKGVALVAAEQWTVSSAEELKKGDAIKVKEVRGNELIVEKLLS